MTDAKPIITFHGHGCTQLTKGDVSIIIDPFLNDNPQAKVTAAEVKADYILVTHGHFDHCADVCEIANNNRAMIIATYETANQVACDCPDPVIDTLGFGAKKAYDFGFVRVTPAWHGSGVAGALPSGFVVNFFGSVIYFAGDTGLFSDMKLLGELEDIDYAVLPIGGYFTMGPEDAALAANFVRAKGVFPVHYNTWPPIEQDVNAFKQLVEAQFNIPVYALAPGESKEL